MFTEAAFCRAVAYLGLFVAWLYAGVRLAIWWID